MQLAKCVWFGFHRGQTTLHHFLLVFLFLTRILGAPMRLTSFIESFVIEAFHENFGMISSLPILIDPQVAYAIILLCYAQHLNYLLHTVFPSPSILQHYIEFDIHTIVTLKKLLDVRSFGDFFDHLVHRQTIFSTFSNGLGLISMVRIAAPTFLGCWALITPALVTHFQHDDCFILLDTIIHVETGTFPFQMAFQDVQAMLPQVVHSQVPPFESLVVQFYS